MTSDEIERLRAELDQWRRLTDPQTLQLTVRTACAAHEGATAALGLALRELESRTSRDADWYMAVVWPLLPVPGEFDGMDACDQSRWRSVVRIAIEHTLAGERGMTHNAEVTGNARR